MKVPGLGSEVQSQTRPWPADLASGDDGRVAIFFRSSTCERPVTSDRPASGLIGSRAAGPHFLNLNRAALIKETRGEQIEPRCSGRRTCCRVTVNIETPQPTPPTRASMFTGPEAVRDN